jgi:DUF917 family protein
MAKNVLDRQSLEDIVWGSTVFGAGGGGSPHDGLKLIEGIVKEITLLSVEDVPENAHAVVVAGIGAPKTMLEKGFGPEAILAFETIKNMAAVGGIRLDYLMPGEIGGLNTITPFYVAAQRGVPVVDADGCGRAVPELSTALYPIYQIPASPLVVANKDGDTIVAYLGDPLNNAAAETIARTAAIAFGGVAAFATWIVDMATIKRCLVPNSVSKAGAIGKAIRETKARGGDIESEVIKVTGGRELFRGQIKKIESKTAEGFDFAKTIVEGTGNYQGKTFTIDSKNENIIGSLNGEPVIMVPDLIAMITIAGEPLTNADTKEGMQIAIIGIPAPEPWHRTPGGFDCWRPILEKLGYRGGYHSFK